MASSRRGFVHARAKTGRRCGSLDHGVSTGKPESGVESGAASSKSDVGRTHHGAGSNPWLNRLRLNSWARKDDCCNGGAQGTKETFSLILSAFKSTRGGSKT